MLLHLRQGTDAVAIYRCGFIVEIGGRLVHQPYELLLRLAAAALQKIARFRDQFSIGLAGNLARARRTAAFDLEQQAGARSALKDAVGAGSQQEGLLQRVEGCVDRTGAGKGAEIITLPAACATMFQYLRKCVIAGQQDMREGLVIPHQHIVARLQPLDQVGFEQQRIGLGRRGDEFHLRRHRNHTGDAVRLSGQFGVARHTLLQASGLADIKQLAAGVIHAIDARTVGQQADLGRNQSHARPVRMAMPPGAGFRIGGLSGRFVFGLVHFGLYSIDKGGWPGGACG